MDDEATVRSLLEEALNSGRSLEEVDLVQEGRILNDERVRVNDRLPCPDRRIGDPAEGHDGRTGAF